MKKHFPKEAKQLLYYKSTEHISSNHISTRVFLTVLTPLVNLLDNTASAEGLIE